MARGNLMASEPEFCGAKSQTGSCRQPPGAGTAHPGVGRCRWHGGSSPQAQLSGQLVIARQEAMVMGTPLPMEPHEAILQCIAIAAGEVRYASEQIAKLELEDAVGMVVTTHTRPRKFFGGAEIADDEGTVDGEATAVAGDRSATGWVTEVKHEAPALHIWITTRRAAMDRLVQYSATALKAGVEERRVRVAESVGQALADAMRGVLLDLGMADDPRAPAVMRKHLTLLAGVS
jgi:hypothetical protein